MPRINLTSKGLSWAQPLVAPEPSVYEDHDADGYGAAAGQSALQGSETQFTSHGSPVLSPLPDSIGAVFEHPNVSGLASQLVKGPSVLSANLADSTPIGFSVYVVMLALVFYSLHLWINVLSKAVAYFSADLAMANWAQLTGPQLTLFSLVFTLVLKYGVDLVRSYWSDLPVSSKDDSTAASP